MRIRLATLCAIAAAVTVGAPPTLAKPKPPCRQIIDPTGDGHAKTAGFDLVSESDALDITGGDVATGKRYLVGVLRLVSTDSGSANNPGGFSMAWNLNFTVRGTRYTFERQRAFGTQPSYTYSFAGKPLPASAVKTTPTEIRWTVPRSALDALKRPNVVFESISATTTWYFTNADDASAKTGFKYKDKSPSCLNAG